MLRDSDRSLKGIALFAGIEPARLQALERGCSFRRFEPEQQVFDRLAPTTDLMAIVRGSVRLVIYAASGREVRFGDLRAGECFGELACLDRNPRSASALVLVETVIAAISPTLLERLMIEEPVVAGRMLRRMARSVRNSTDRIVELSILGSYNRVCAELLRRASHDSAGSAGGAAKGVISPYPVRADIAAHISTSEGTVSRVISDLQRSNLVVREGDNLVVRDLARLRQLVERCSGDPEDDTLIL